MPKEPCLTHGHPAQYTDTQPNKHILSDIHMDISAQQSPARHTGTLPNTSLPNPQTSLPALRAHLNNNNKNHQTEHQLDTDALEKSVPQMWIIKVSAGS